MWRTPQGRDRLVHGHWESDLTKGAKNRYTVGILVKLTSLVYAVVKDGQREGRSGAERI